jgi:LacI family transcriptional regulator
LPTIDHLFAQCLLWEIQNQLKNHRKTMMILPEQDNALSNRLHLFPLDGVILLSAEIGQELVTRFKQMGIALVMCSALPFLKNMSSVHVDDLAAAYDGVSYLLDLGHRKIGFITDSPQAIGSGFQRTIGCQKAMEDRGIPVDDSMFYSGNCDYDSGFRGTEELIRRCPDLSAIFAHSDISALGALAALADQGIHVPADISVLGFDGVRFGAQSRPRLSSVHQPITEIVEKTLELLINDIENPGKQSPMSINLRHHINPGETCRSLVQV